MSGGRSSGLRIAWFVALFSTGLLAGLLFDFWAFITPALATLPGPAFVAVTQAIDRQFLVPIVFVYVVVNLSGLAVVLLLLRERGSPAFALTTAALVGTLVGTASTLLINVPINLEVINTWSAQAPPANWAEVRDRWDQAHAFRTAFFVLTFGCQLVAVLLPGPSQSAHATSPPPDASGQRSDL
jgi:uncharacterized membrane protein